MAYSGGNRESDPTGSSSSASGAYESAAASHALRELQENIRQGDAIKASVVLQHFREYSPRLRQRLLYELSKSPEVFALQVLLPLWEKREDLFEAYPELDRLLLSKAGHASGHILGQLHAQNGFLRGYVRLAGRLRLEQASVSLETLLSRVRDPAIILSLLQSLADIGRLNSPGAVAEFLFWQVSRTSRIAARALAAAGDGHSLEYLFRALGRDRELDSLILDMLADKGSEPATKILARVLRSSDVFLRREAAERLKETESLPLGPLVDNLGSGDADSQIQTMELLARTGREDAVRPIVRLIRSQPKDPNVRFAAYEALAHLPLRGSTYVLASGLLDPEESVRLAVARALARNLDPYLAEGVANMIRDRREGPAIVEAILDSQSGALSLALIRYQGFRELAWPYLRDRAHPRVGEFFLQLLRQQGEQGAADRLAAQLPSSSAAGTRIWAVDDSQTVLQAYRRELYSLGLEPLLFLSPEEVLQRMDQERPHLLFTDLNMPSMNGLELIRRIRDLPGGEGLRVVLVTSRKDPREMEAANRAGADRILHKPFTAEDLREAAAGGPET